MKIKKITIIKTPYSSNNNEYNKVKFNKSQLQIFNRAKAKYDYDKTKPLSICAKRAFDIFAGTVGLMLTAPVILLSAAAVKFETKGPAIFNQKRIGKDGKIFTLKKIRTMYDNPKNDGYNVLSPDDARITKVGKILRKYSIDEFPQFLNIVKGDMSLVGPRPLPKYELDRANNYPQFVERYIVKPGAKLQYYKADLENPKQRFKIEKDYIENWSLKKDFNILSKIVKDVILGKNY